MTPTYALLLYWAQHDNKDGSPTVSEQTGETHQACTPANAPTTENGAKSIPAELHTS